MKKYIILFFALFVQLSIKAQALDNVVDEVIWVVGDEAILKSDVESMRADPDWNSIKGNPFASSPSVLPSKNCFCIRLRSIAYRSPMRK